jgi:hypothetical protein
LDLNALVLLAVPLFSATMIKSPLKDTLLSNSPQNGFDHPNTSPLRIAKRTPSPTVPRRSTRINANHQNNHHSGSSFHLPSAIARRSSSSYRHLRNNNLVSKSPFKSQIPTPPSISFPTALLPTPPRPSTKSATKTERKVSGEKRPRPSSIHDQAEAENDRPLFAYKRDRKQSKGFQGLVEKEPVTKSPFRQQTLPPPPPPSKDVDRTAASTPPVEQQQPTSTTNPPRSSLVSKRLHGPRLSGGGGHGGGHGGGAGRKIRRKKFVHFDETCDVVEYDVEDDGEDGDTLEQSEDEEGEDESFDQPASEEGAGEEHEMDEETDPDTSLTTQLESLIHQSSSGDDILAHAQSLLATNTTPRRRSLTPTPSTPPSTGNRSGDYTKSGMMGRVSEDEGEHEEDEGDLAGGREDPMLGNRAERSLRELFLFSCVLYH